MLSSKILNLIKEKEKIDKELEDGVNINIKELIMKEQVNHINEMNRLINKKSIIDEKIRRIYKHKI